LLSIFFGLIVLHFLHVGSTINEIFPILYSYSNLISVLFYLAVALYFFALREKILFFAAAFVVLAEIATFGPQYYIEGLWLLRGLAGVILGSCLICRTKFGSGFLKKNNAVFYTIGFIFFFRPVADLFFSEIIYTLGEYFWTTNFSYVLVAIIRMVGGILHASLVLISKFVFPSLPSEYGEENKTLNFEADKLPPANKSFYQTKIIILIALPLILIFLIGFFAFLAPYFYRDVIRLRGNAEAQNHPISASMEIDYREGYRSFLLKFANEGKRLSECRLSLDSQTVPLEQLTLYDPVDYKSLVGQDYIPANSQVQIYFGVSHSDIVLKNIKVFGWEKSFESSPFPIPEKVQLECREITALWFKNRPNDNN